MSALNEIEVSIHSMIARICFVLTTFWIIGVTAFVPSSSTQNKNHGMTRPIFKFQKSHVVPSYTRVNKVTIRSMSSTEPEPDSTVTPTTTAQSKDGTFYDDEVKLLSCRLYTRSKVNKTQEHRLTYAFLFLNF